MRVLGLTGSIAMGKTEAANAFRRLRVPVFEADAAVHDLLATPGAAVAEVARAFPAAMREGAVDRQRLGALVFEHPDRLARLEAILHPRVRRRERRFAAAAARRGAALLVLDIPLLFESGEERRCDATAVVSAPAFVQRARALRRPGMTAEKLAAILERQMPDAEKRRRADFVIATGLGRRSSLRRIRAIVTMLADLPHRRSPSPSRRGLHA